MAVEVPEPTKHTAVVAVPVGGDDLRAIEEISRSELVTALLHLVGDFVDPVDEREQPDPRNSAFAAYRSDIVKRANSATEPEMLHSR